LLQWSIVDGPAGLESGDDHCPERADGPLYAYVTPIFDAAFL